jgi:transposase
MVAAATLVAELGDITRFTKPCQLMAYLGLVPSERTSGGKHRQGGVARQSKPDARDNQTDQRQILCCDHK